jgi:hypothetical protein
VEAGGSDEHGSGEIRSEALAGVHVGEFVAHGMGDATCLNQAACG